MLIGRVESRHSRKQERNKSRHRERKGSWQGTDRLARLISTESASKKVVAECGEEGQGPNRDSER